MAKSSAIKSDTSHARLDGQSRERKANKILSVLKEHKTLSKSVLLDIGTGSGHIIALIAKKTRKAVSVDLYDERIEKRGYEFKKVPSEKLPFKDNAFDIAISNHVLEHVPNQALHLSEIHRVLKKGGILYLATPNRWWIMDPHYKLPFITWLPANLAARYLRWAKKKDNWDIYSLSYLALKKLAGKHFEMIDITPKLMKFPSRYGVDAYPLLQKAAKLIPLPLLKACTPLTPTFVYILKKK